MNIIEISEIIGRLKTTKRTGWIEANIPDPESIADHSYRVALFVMILSDKMGLDTEKAVRMSLVHDLGEALIGDVVTEGPSASEKKETKTVRERQALEKILSAAQSPQYIELFDEFEKSESAEARLVAQIDKLEMALQALEYEKAHGKRLDRFFATADKMVWQPELREMLERIEGGRPRIP
ncbi:MAG: HD domain-containing protein [Candidatus Micrarchaeota archaeon]|nr:HD domain-containing protein [Candidatus Micrarchaeota archaeon]MDE1848190.1 HD domain-containing protein [Candidatus Micrarchaeota archaeon]MDE1864837.1 HD domain-containing protein [Candidatus Micrarchaeota archaeon]